MKQKALRQHHKSLSSDTVYGAEDVNQPDAAAVAAILGREPRPGIGINKSEFLLLFQLNLWSYGNPMQGSR